MTNTKGFLLALVLSCTTFLILISCDTTTPRTNLEDYGGTERSDIIIVDSCEYIVVSAYRKYGITHKGNCKNPIHKYNN